MQERRFPHPVRITSLDLVQAVVRQT